MKIFVEDTFDSAHWLPNVPVDHKCHNLHGHTYKIRIEVEGEINPTSGWVVDYAEIKKLWDPIKLQLDHKCLNEIEGLENSTSELLVEWVWDRMIGFFEDAWIQRIEIRETEHCGAIKEI